PPCQGVATPAAGAVAPTGDRPLWVPYSRPPLRAPRYKRLCPQTTTAPCGRLPPLAGAAGLPFGLALAVASRPLARGGLSCGLAVGGWPPILAAFAAKTQQERIERFYIWIEKMKEVKRPPL
ncbi:hypothetical protein GW17_00038196, partial [Ensete ventricosum]